MWAATIRASALGLISLSYPALVTITVVLGVILRFTETMCYPTIKQYHPVGTIIIRFFFPFERRLRFPVAHPIP